MDIIINATLDSVPQGLVPITSLGNFYHNILACLAYPSDFPPVADLLRQYHGLEGQWLIVSPIHWQATHNDAMIIAEGNELGLSETESHQWFDVFNEFVSPENMMLHYHDAHTWLLRCDGKPEVVAKPVHTLRHKSMMPELQCLDKTLFFQRFITETQMLLSAHPLNKSRTGLLPINGVWLWGGGKLHAPLSIPIVGHNQRLVRLAKLLSTHVYDEKTVPFLTKDSMLLFNDVGQLDHSDLHVQLQKKSARWYWNNLAYFSKPKSWLSRLMEKMHHAN